MDNTLLKGRIILKIAEKKGFRAIVMEIMQSDEDGYKKTIEIARLLREISAEEFLKIFRTIPLQERVKEIMRELKNKGIKTAIVTDSYQLAVQDLKKRLGIDYVFSNNLIIDNKNHLTGDVMLNNENLTKRFEDCKIHSICKRDVLRHLCKELGIKPAEVIAVGDSDVDICMLKNAGLGVAFNAPEKVRKNADISTEDLREILNYI